MLISKNDTRPMSGRVSRRSGPKATVFELEPELLKLIQTKLF